MAQDSFLLLAGDVEGREAQARAYKLSESPGDGYAEDRTARPAYAGLDGAVCCGGPGPMDVRALMGLPSVGDRVDARSRPPHGLKAMRGDPNFCREKAARCAALAAEQKDPVLKATFADVAGSWQRIAKQLERLETFIAQAHD